VNNPTHNFREAKIILISYVTAGTGHRRAAEAIAEAVRKRLPHAQLECVDLLQDSPWWLQWAYPRIYKWFVRYIPSFWAIAYYVLDHPWVFRIVQPWRRRWNWLVARRFVRWVKSVQPDVVVATHFFPADVVAAAKQAGWLTSRLIVVLTDLFPHRLWLAPGAEAIVGATDQTKLICQTRGIEAHRIHVIGIPVRAEFSRPGDRHELRQKLGLDPSRVTLLMASGGMGIGPIQRLVRRVLALEQDRPGRLQLLVVCGYNRRLAKRLARVGAGSAMPVRIFEFVEPMHELMGASDLLVTKAGGLTVVEACALGLPMVFCGTIPGQERFNAQFAVQHGAGVMARSVKEVVSVVLRLLENPGALAEMRTNALALGKPRAAEDLVERLIVQ